MGKPKTLNKVGASSDNPNRDAKGKGGMRSKATIQRLNMYKGGKPVRDEKGKIIGGTLVMSTTAGGKDITKATGRIAPDRKWFGNTRTIAQNELDKFRAEMSVRAADPYSVVLRRKKIPMALLQDASNVANVNLIETESFESVFGSKCVRKRPKLSGNALDYDAIMKNVTSRGEAYDSCPTKDSNIEVELERGGDARKEDLFAKGQSKRIWGELYKVLDSSDVVIEVLDARNVPGTRCTHVENHIRKNASHKQLVFVINKCDLVPAWVTRKWVQILSKQYPTVAFHASITNSFGKGALINLLRQFGKLHSDKRQISVGVIGYPNTGKSSVINTLKGTKCCKTAPIPGETKVWQYIALMRRIFLIDCPGVVYDVGDDETETVLKGVVRAERLQSPTDFIDPILQRVKGEYLENKYGVKGWTDGTSFLTMVATKSGKLLRGGEPDLNNVAVSVINDWQRGKIPYFVAPPRVEGEEEGEDAVAEGEELMGLGDDSAIIGDDAGSDEDEDADIDQEELAGSEASDDLAVAQGVESEQAVGDTKDVSEEDTGENHVEGADVDTEGVATSTSLSKKTIGEYRELSWNDL